MQNKCTKKLIFSRILIPLISFIILIFTETYLTKHSIIFTMNFGIEISRKVLQVYEYTVYLWKYKIMVVPQLQRALFTNCLFSRPDSFFFF